MAGPAAKERDVITGMDSHMILPPSGTASMVPGHVFRAALADDLSANVFIDGFAAAVVGSSGKTNPGEHPPIGGTFATPITFQGTITMGSMSVFINGTAAARAGDPAITCNELPTNPLGDATVVVESSTVFIGDGPGV